MDQEIKERKDIPEDYKCWWCGGSTELIIEHKDAKSSLFCNEACEHQWLLFSSISDEDKFQEGQD